MERPSSFCSRVLLKIFLTAGGAGAAFSAQNASGSEYRQGRASAIRRSRSTVTRSGAFVRFRRPKVQAGRP